MAKSVEVKYCAHCGAMVKPDAAFCPSCGYSFKTGQLPRVPQTPQARATPVKKKKAAPAIIAVSAVLFFCIVFGITLSSGGDSQQPASGDGSGPTESGTPITGQSLHDAESTPVYEDDYCAVKYVEAFDYAEIYPTEQDLGVCYIRLDIENRSDQSLTVVMTELYVNDVAVTATRGTPMDLAPGKRSREPFIFSYSNLSIGSRKEIERIECVLTYFDEDFNAVYTSEVISLPAD